jgi:hypothetical protein
MKVKTNGRLKARYGEERLAVMCRDWPKNRTQGDAESRKKLASAQGRLTCRAVPALRKGRSTWGPGKTTDANRGRSRTTLYEALGQTLELEVVKRAAEISIGLRKVTGHCVGVVPFRNERDAENTVLGKEEMAVRL